MSRKRKQKRDALFMIDGCRGAALLRERLASRQWWCFVIVRFAGLDFVEALEKKYYFGRKSRNDFEMLGFPFVAGLGVVAVGMAHKRRLSVKQLAQQLDAGGMVREAETLARHHNDVIVLSQLDECPRVQAWLTTLVTGNRAAPVRSC